MAPLCIYLMPLVDYHTHNIQVGNKDHIQGLKVTISEVSPVMTNVSLDQFKEHTIKDPVMRQLHTYILQG